MLDQVLRLVGLLRREFRGVDADRAAQARELGESAASDSKSMTTAVWASGRKRGRGRGLPPDSTLVTLAPDADGLPVLSLDRCRCCDHGSGLSSTVPACWAGPVSKASRGAHVHLRRGCGDDDADLGLLRRVTVLLHQRAEDIRNRLVERFGLIAPDSVMVYSRLLNDLACEYAVTAECALERTGYRHRASRRVRS